MELAGGLSWRRSGEQGFRGGRADRGAGRRRLRRLPRPTPPGFASRRPCPLPPPRFNALADRFPFLVTASVKTSASRRCDDGVVVGDNWTRSSDAVAPPGFQPSRRRGSFCAGARPSRALDMLLFPWLAVLHATSSQHSRAAPSPRPAARYPSLIEPGLFLGDWDAAAATDRLRELGVKGCGAWARPACPLGWHLSQARRLRRPCAFHRHAPAPAPRSLHHTPQLLRSPRFSSLARDHRFSTLSTTSQPQHTHTHTHAGLSPSTTTPRAWRCRRA